MQRQFPAPASEPLRRQKQKRTQLALKRLLYSLTSCFAGCCWLHFFVVIVVVVDVVRAFIFWCIFVVYFAFIFFSTSRRLSSFCTIRGFDRISMESPESHDNSNVCDYAWNTEKITCCLSAVWFTPNTRIPFFPLHFLFIQYAQHSSVECGLFVCMWTMHGSHWLSLLFAHLYRYKCYEKCFDRTNAPPQGTITPMMTVNDLECDRACVQHPYRWTRASYCCYTV